MFPKYHVGTREIPVPEAFPEKLNKCVCVCMCVCACSVVFNSATPWVVGLQPARLPCPWGFSSQEYKNALLCPLPGVLPDPGIEPTSLKSSASADGF